MINKLLFKYCPYCAAPLKDGTENRSFIQICPNCGWIHYFNPVPSSAILPVLPDGQIVLIRRQNEPFAGKWAIPSGFVEYGENPEETALRELKEETGLTGKIDSLLDISEKETPAYGSVLVITYLVNITGGEMEAHDDAKEIAAFSPDKFPPIEIKLFQDVLDKYKRRQSAIAGKSH
ncbi:bifunctional NMN adenylyltransferase/Nudix hydrolase [bacterium BMS3Bbin03]|nr:bifunctional NMN adenylyltransferase/Nudix hydrolase [bacterium BMS3Bbin03]